MASIWKKLASILLEEEEITIEEDLNEVSDMIEIPKLKPMAETPAPKPIVEEKTIAQEIIEHSVVTERKSMMIDVDVKVEKEIKEEVPLVKKVQPVKYQKTEIISPIFGGPTNPSEPVEAKVYTQAKTRQPLTEIISPMFGKVEQEDQKSGIDASVMEIDLSEMLRPNDNGDEVQASLFDYLEGFNENEE